MGKKAVLTKSRQRETHQKHQKRVQRTEAARQKRRGTDEEEQERRIQKVVVKRPLPTDEDKELLLRQFKEACRLPLPCVDLCALLQQYIPVGAEEEGNVEEKKKTAELDAKSSRKRAREEAQETGLSLLNRITEEFLKTPDTPAGEANEDEEVDDDAAAMAEDVPTVLEEMLQADGGRRVIVTLLAALNFTDHPKKDQVLKVLLETFQENEGLTSHYVACRVLSALAQYGDEDTQKGVLELMMQQAMSMEGLRKLLTDRHTATSIQYLLRQLPKPTSSWLCEALFGFSDKPASQKKGAKRTKKSAEADESAAAGSDERMSSEQLLELVEHPVAGQVLQQLAQLQESRSALLHLFDPKELLHTKRGTAFLSQLLAAPEDTNKATEAAMSATTKKELSAVVEAVLNAIKESLSSMCLDKNANFVVQRIIKLLPYTSGDAKTSLRQLVSYLGEGPSVLQELAAHSIGVHVVLTLIDVGNTMGLGDEIGGAILQGMDLEKDIIPHTQGQLVVRHLLPLIAEKKSKIGAELNSLLTSKSVDFSFDGMGNLVVQDYLKQLGAVGASKFAVKLQQDSQLFTMCQDSSASHVVFTLLDLVDASTQTAMCNTLKKSVVQLALHVNGRFIVEKLIRLSREIRDELVRQFMLLAQSKGTQHLLCTLFVNLDVRGKQHLVGSLIVPNLSSLATHTCGSVALQKLMQTSDEVLYAVRAALASNGRLRTDLLQNFFGKFVVRIAEEGN